MRLTIAARPARGGDALPRVMVTQFNVQPARVLIYGLADGRYDAEQDAETGANWRWTGGRFLVARGLACG